MKAINVAVFSLFLALASPAAVVASNGIVGGRTLPEWTAE